ncbi:carboxymuconolactone decarboxylase family protein [Gordonia sp. ABSL11-1]|uniref:carboxymuconolactone decarboxylase family protein n=1 Tax=Gordonia sp. ABSL11-1 TaxID=3053924 RepID=UPI002572598C|nr:carboxymuconolactone decarboxylase family protein [Gordonia sp. ABSL11-1]MDL9948734.1 carboxymuconolactone decarboxylase family protein [Gordonia sp. ABSL11-1]
MTDPDTPTPQSEERRRGLEMMSQVYGWEMSDGPGLHFAHTADQLFAQVWTREGLSIRDRRLLLLGALAAGGQVDVAEIQAGAALGNGELTPEQLEEIALFLCYYVGWPIGTKMNMMFGEVSTKYRKSQQPS